MRRLTRSLGEITVIEGTRPSLPEDDLLFPAYVERAVVKPFVARVPRGAEMERLLGWLRRALDAPNPSPASSSWSAGSMERSGG